MTCRHAFSIVLVGSHRTLTACKWFFQTVVFLPAAEPFSLVVVMAEVGPPGVAEVQSALARRVLEAALEMVLKMSPSYWLCPHV